MGTGGGTVPREGLEGLDSRSASLTFSESTAEDEVVGTLAGSTLSGPLRVRFRFPPPPPIWSDFLMLTVSCWLRSSRILGLPELLLLPSLLLRRGWGPVLLLSSCRSRSEAVPPEAPGVTPPDEDDENGSLGPRSEIDQV